MKTKKSSQKGKKSFNPVEYSREMYRKYYKSPFKKRNAPTAPDKRWRKEGFFGNEKAELGKITGRW